MNFFELGAVVDATVIESAAGPRRTLELTASDSANEKEHYQLKKSVGPDARWLQKANRYCFGYKAYVRTNSGQGYIEAVHVTSANEAEVNQLSALSCGTKAKRLYADKGYYSKENRQQLKQQGLKNGLMYKAFRAHPLTRWQKPIHRRTSFWNLKKML